MANAAIISVGNELLNGNTVDTNSNWLCGRLIAESISVVYSCAVADDIEEIANAIQYVWGKADIILITGGLGPTDDDITRDGIAKFLGVQLEYHPDIFEKIKKFFAVLNYPMPEKNKIQAYLPKGTSEIENDRGTAPGIYYDDGKKSFRKGDKALRLRRMRIGRKEKAALTFKGPRLRGRFKQRQEIQFGIDDAKSAEIFLEALGYKKTLIYQKKRRLWRLGGCEVALDELPLLGTFVEIEGPDEKRIAAVQEKLGLSDLQHIPESYACLMERELRGKGLRRRAGGG